MSPRIPVVALLCLMVLACSCGGKGTESGTIERTSSSTTEPEATDTNSARVAVDNRFESISEALAQARIKWADNGTSNYSLTVAESRNYWLAGCRWTSEVIEGVPSRTTLQPSSAEQCSGQQWTVETLHELVAEMLREVEAFAAPEFGQHELQVSFDSSGIPEEINFDLANASDEERSIKAAASME